MSQYLRLIHSLLLNLGGVASPEIFSLRDEYSSPTESPTQSQVKKGSKTFSPESFMFFQGMLSRAYIIGHIPQDDGHSFPLILTINASGIVARESGSLKPYFTPAIRETVLLPSKLPFDQDEIDKYTEYGLDIERYETSEPSYKGIRASAARKALDILADVKESVYISFLEALGESSYLVLIDDSLRPSKEIVNYSSWVGLRLNPPLSAAEESVSLKLGENEIGPPFKLTANGKGYFWHLRMLSDIRKGPGYGIVRVDNALTDGEDMESKIGSISAAILAERYPIHPAARTEGWGLYPLITARVYLNTQTTSETVIMKYF